MTDFESDEGNIESSESSEHFNQCGYVIFRTLLSTPALVVLVIMYSILGAWIFFLLETPDMQNLSAISKRREECLKELWAITERLNVLYERNWTSLVHEQLIRFENLITADSRDILLETTFHQQYVKWSFGESLLYSISIITTIGHGNFSPNSFKGKIVTMIYALIGVPLFLMCLSNLGGLFAEGLQYVYQISCNHNWNIFNTGLIQKHSQSHKIEYKCGTHKTKRLDKPINCYFQNDSNHKAKETSMNLTEIVRSSVPQQEETEDQRDIQLEFTHNIKNLHSRYLHLPLQTQDGQQLMPVENTFTQHKQGQQKMQKTNQKEANNILTTVDCNILGEKIDYKEKYCRHFTKGSPISNMYSQQSNEDFKSKESHKVNKVVNGNDQRRLKLPSLESNCTNSQSTTQGMIFHKFSVNCGCEIKKQGLNLESPQLCAIMNSTECAPYNTTHYLDEDDNGSNPIGCSFGTPSRLPLLTKRQSQNNITTEEDCIQTYEFTSEGEEIEADLPYHQLNINQQLPITLILFILILYLTFGSLMFSSWENWSIVDGAYFCFATLSTIGFDENFMPKKMFQEFGFQLLVCCLYLLLGLILFAMAFIILETQLIWKYRTNRHST